MKYHVTLTVEVPSAVSRNAAIASAKLVCLSKRGGEFLLATTAIEADPASLAARSVATLADATHTAGEAVKKLSTELKKTKPAWRKRTTK